MSGDFGIMCSAQFIVPFVIGVVAFIFRKLPFFGAIWWIYKWFFIAFFVVLFVDKAKDGVKEWWND